MFLSGKYIVGDNEHTWWGEERSFHLNCHKEPRHV